MLRLSTKQRLNVYETTSRSGANFVASACSERMGGDGGEPEWRGEDDDERTQRSSYVGDGERLSREVEDDEERRH